MAGSIGVVRQVVGEVFAVAADGSRRLLTEGDRVFAGEQLVTGAQGAVAVALANGQELVLGRESSMALNNGLLAGTPDATQSAAADSAATPSEQDLTDVEKLQAAIEAGVDPTQAAEATAAGPGSGGGGSGNAGGGHSFVLLGETAGRVDPNIGFPTGPIGSVPEFPNPNPDVAIAAEELEIVVPPVNGVPVAEDDAQTVGEGGEGVQGNVLDNDDGGPDLPTQFLSWQAPGASSGPNGSLLVSTPYGVVTLNPDGSYNFELANGTPAVEGLGEGETVNIDFGYSIQDGNGDQSSANLTITIVGQNDVPTVEVNFPNAEGGVVRVFERGLPGGSSEGDGSNVVHGTFTIRDPDGLDKLKSLGVGGLDLQIDPDHPLASLIGGGFEAAFGTVRITGFDASTGTFSFSYTLTRPISDLAAGDERDGFLISLSDGLGLPISTNVSIEIVDDVPQANPDSGGLTENGVPSSLSGNVLGNDVGGADQPKAFTSWNGVAGATAGEGGSLLVNTPYGVVTLNADGSYSFVLANGSAAVEALTEGQQVTLQYAYSMQDADGDPSSSTLTLTITGSNDLPTIEVSSPDAEGGLAQVFEKGLADGSSAGDGSTVTTGSFSVADSDGLANLKTLSVGSLTVDLTTSGFASLVGQSFAAAHGTVLITGYSNGTYSFSYTLTEATTDTAGPETDGFLINVGDGLANASATVTIEIVDDLPQANPDSGSLTENGVPSSLSGNVLGNDVGGADQPKAFTSWNGVAGATAGENGSLLVNTPYGVVTLNADGSYSFALANGSAAVEALTEGQQVTLQYAYSMQDADGDPSNSTLTLTITGSNDLPTIEVSTPDAENGLAQVFEKGLADGSSAGDGSTVTTGSFSVADSDGLANLKTLSVGSLTVDLATSGFASLVGQSFAAAHGTVLITGYSNGTYSFSYTLTEATTDTAGPETDGFLINVGDGLANASATVTIEIVDDLPQANPDSGSLTENGVPSSLSGNVLGNDVGGADQPKAFTSWNGVAGATAGEGGSLLVNTPYGVVTLNADGSYSFVLANGSAAVEALTEGQQVTLQYAYSMQDADGDPSNSTLTLTITGSNDLPTIEVSTPDAENGLAQVFEKGLADGSSAGDGSTVTTGSFSVADSDGLANLKTLSVGSLTVDLATSGFASLVGQSFAAAHGTVLITGYSNGTYSFSYTLTEATTDTAGPETDGFLINVGDGLANASATVTIEIVDDLPQAKADDASVSEGSSVSGNVVSGAGLGSVADVFGADGRPSPATGVVGVRTGGDVSTPAAGGVGVPIDTGLGTLVLHADGSYTYTSHANALGQAGAVDTFTYTIVDADGDLSTTTLTIDLSNVTVVGDVKAGSDDDVREAALGFGSEPTSNDEFASGTLVANGGNGPYSFSLGVGAGTGQYGQLVVNSNGSYTYTLISAPKVNPDNNGNNLQFTETFTFTVTDANGNTGIGTLTIDIIDDVPSISVRGLEGLDLQVDETTLGATDSTSFAGAFSSVFGADGAALSNAITYSLDVKSPGVDSGLRDTATGSSILLFKEGADIVGRVVGGGQLAFRLSVAADGTLTLDQSRAIFHTPNDGPDQAAGLAGTDLITLNATITDGDGDRDSASLDLGNAISFKDDAPSIDPYVKVCLDDDALPYGNPGGVGDSDPDTRNTSGTIAHDFGADGPGEIELQDSGAPHGFTYVETQGGLLIKQGDVTVITITLDKFTGAYTVTQNAPILHANGYDENDLTFEVEYKIVDRDGDRADGSLYIKVDDDTPVVTSHLAQSGSLEVDETYFGQSASTDFSGLFSGGHGADGAGSSQYSLGISGEGADSGLDDSETGVDILLYTLGDGVVGRVGGEDGEIVFKVSVDGYGNVSLQQLRAILHTPDSGPDQAAGLASADLVTLTLTLTDRDGDSASASIGLGNAISFRDDAPKVSANEAVQLDDDALYGGNPSGTGDVDPNTANLTGTLAHSVGADRPGSISLLTSGAPDGFSYVKDGDNLLIKQSGVTVITLTLNWATGAYSVVQNLPVSHPAGGDENDLSFTIGYKVTDADGDSAQGSLTINVDDDMPTVTTTAPVQLDDDALYGGIPYGTGDVSPDTSNLGGILGHSFGADGPGAVSLLATGAPDGFSYVKDGHNLLIKQGGQTVITLTLNPATGAYQVTQNKPILHEDGQHENDVSFTINYQVSDKDGDTADGSLTINVDDDTPQAKNDSACVNEARTEDFNVVFVLDFSGSIDNAELDQMLTAVRAAGQALFNGANGDVKVQIVAFSGTAGSYPVATDFTTFSNQIKALNPAESGSRPFNGQTDFTAAIEKTMTDYHPIAGYNNQVFFISDGNPNEQTGTGDNSLDDGTAGDWSDFIAEHGLHVTAIGVGNGISTPRLQDVDLDGSGMPIAVGSFSGLINTLLGQVSNGLVSGNVLRGNDGAVGGGDDDNFGADGAGYIKSIVIGGSTHSWNGDPASAQLSNILTTAGGKLSFNFATGAWSYVAPSGISADVLEQFTYTLVDADNDPSSAVLSITVKAQDDAPMAKDDFLSTSEDQALTITAQQLFGADGTGPLNDSDGDSASFTSIRITQLASNGVLKLDGTNVNPNQVISLADINAGKLEFVPDANEHGDPYATFKYQVSDGTSYSNVATVTIEVTPENDAPVAKDDSFSTHEDSAVTISYSGLFGADGTGGNNDYDIDSASFTKIKITQLPVDGQLQLNGVPVGPGAEVTVADISAGKLKFVPDADESGNPYATFKYQVSDGALYSNEASVTIKVDPVNDKPLLDLDDNDSSGATGANYQSSYTEGGPAVAIADLDTRVTDVDDSNIESATIVLTNAKAGDVLSLGTLSGGISGVVNTSVAGKITVTLTGSATKAAYETAIESIRYSNSSNTPDTTPRNLTVVVNDGNLNSNVAESRINVSAVDNAPDARNDQASVTEGQGQDFNVVFVLDFSGSISNTELNQMLSAVRAAGQALFDGTTGDVKLQIVAFSSTATSYPVATDFSTFSAQIAAINPAEDGSRPFNGNTDFTAGIEKTMDAYQPLSGYSNQVVFISDGNPNEQTGSNNNSLADGTATDWNNFVDGYHLNVTTVGIGDGINSNRLQDVDLDGQGSPLTVSGFEQLVGALLSQVVGGDVSGNVLHGNDNTPGTADDDSFGLDGAGYIKSIVINGVTYTWNGSDNIDASTGPDIAGSVLSNVGTTAGGKLTFNFASGAWSYVAPQGITANVTEHFTYSLVDADGTSGSAALSVTVVDVNTAPTGADKSISVLEDGSRVLTAADFGFSDSDGDSLLAVKITTLPDAGNLVLAGGPVLVPGASVSVADINDGKLSFVPTANGYGNGYASFSFQVQDNGGTGNGGIDLDQSANLITFNVTPVNDAPLLGSMGGTLVYTENASAKVIDSSVTLSDIDSPNFDGGKLTVAFSANGTAADQLSILAGGNITLQGSQNVRYNGNTIGTWGGGSNGSALVISFNSAATLVAVQALIQRIAYANSDDAPSVLDRTLSFTLDDGDGTANGGQNLATAYALVQVNAVNDIPVAQSDRVVTNSSGSVAIPEWAIVWNDRDPEGSPLDVAYVGGGSGGSPTHNPGAGYLGNVTFSDASGSFTYRTGDENGASSTNSTITVTSDTSGALGNDGTSTDQIVIDASNGGKTLRGGSGEDVLIGGVGDDTLEGNGGDDLLVGGADDDILRGGSGSDTAAYLDAPGGVTVNLALTTDQDTGNAGLDRLIDIENLLGSRFDDVLTGNSGDNVLAGNGGDDLLDGGAGADTFKWLPGDNGVTTIAGFNPGVDKLDLSQLLSGEHSDVGSLDDYLTMAFGANTTITVDSNAAATGGEGQTIVLQGVNLMAAYSAPDTASVISHMLDDGSLKVDV
ncbi:VCBS repeat-containing protein [Metapseudomonas resinovorans]|uniref:retention module-containing protein n=1 Tax=Metapseudomonas resinovorans TaxID=53412 RepID=UPI003D193504